MPGKALYEAAQAFRRLAVWDVLSDTDMFAVQYADGLTGYVSVMGNAGAHFALAVYFGDEGLTSLLDLANLPEHTSAIRHMQIGLRQQCLLCTFVNRNELSPSDVREIQDHGLSFSGKHGWPEFSRKDRFTAPWNLQGEADEERLLVALRAGVEVGMKLRAPIPLEGADYQDRALAALGFANPHTIPLLTQKEGGFAFGSKKRKDLSASYPGARLSNELEAARLKKRKPEKELVWVMDIFALPLLAEGTPPRFPLVVLLVNTSANEIFTKAVDGEEALADACIELAAAKIEEIGKPAAIVMRDEMTYGMMRGFAEQVGIPALLNDAVEENLDALIGDMLTDLAKIDSDGHEETPPDDRGAPEALPAAAQAKCVCGYCGRLVSKSAMLRHLKTCEKREVLPGDELRFILRATGTYDPAYCVYLDIAADTTLQRLDAYLRELWLECCGHMSAFHIHGDDYYSIVLERGDLSMRHKLSEVVDPKQKFRHTYDFGSETELTLEIVATFNTQKRRDKIRLMARNEPPAYACALCGKPAAHTLAGGCLDPGAMRCEACAKDEDAEQLLPVVNSPRCGTCAYGTQFDETDR